MPIILRTNQYSGVNAHLNSALQNTEGDWEVFHTAHITHIAEVLDQQLPESYKVGLNKSLQIMEFHPDTGERQRRPKADVTIYNVNPQAKRAPVRTSSSGSVPTILLPAIEMIGEEDIRYLTAVVIHQIQPDETRVPVTRIELLSPTNKPPGDGYLQYH
jgi:hypothetical protein